MPQRSDVFDWEIPLFSQACAQTSAECCEKAPRPAACEVAAHCNDFLPSGIS
jgi:hypothetical protein